MSIVIYSANINDYDIHLPLEYYDKKVRYILFTDNKYLKSKIWEINHIDFLDSKLDPKIGRAHV